MYSFSEVRDFYRAVAAVSGLPVLVYFFPKACPSVDSPVQVLELCHIPNVIGVKFTHMDLFALSCLKSEGLKVFNGHDEVLLAGLLMGADGGIGSFYNLVPDLFVQLYRLARSQRWEEARRVQGQVNELIRITSRYPLIPAVKLMLRWLGVECGDCIPPRRSMTEEEEARLCGELKRSAFAERLVM
jgi:N-acetylneuraminate lyase